MPIYNQNVFFECCWTLQKGGVNWDCYWKIIQKGTNVTFAFLEIVDAEDYSSQWDAWGLGCDVSIDCLTEAVKKTIECGKYEVKKDQNVLFTLELIGKKITITFCVHSYPDDSRSYRTVEIHYSVLANLGFLTYSHGSLQQI